MRMPAAESTYERDPMSTSRRRVGAFPLVKRTRPARAFGLGLFEAHVTEVRARVVDAADQASAPLRPERTEVVHLLEERRQVLRLGDRDLVAQLQEALVVPRPAPGGRHVGARRREQARCTVASSLSSSRTMSPPSGSSSRPRTTSDAPEMEFVEGVCVTVKRFMCGCRSPDASQNGLSARAN